MLFLSIGENGLVGNIIERFGYKDTFDTPYTKTRSNICYAVQCEKREYNNLLDKDKIEKDSKSRFSNEYRNKDFDGINSGLFSWDVDNGFEFTMKDPLNKKDDFELIKKEIDKLLKLKETEEDICFFYNHKYIENDSIDEVVEYTNIFIKEYKKNNSKRNIVIITQQLVKNVSDRKVEIYRKGESIICVFYTLSVWKGKDFYINSGEVDDDLFIKMFKELYQINILDDISFIEKYENNRRGIVLTEEKLSIDTYIDMIIKEII